MSVSACIVTRGDVELDEILESIPRSWELVIWDNGTGTLSRALDGGARWDYEREHRWPIRDLAVYGRYQAALEHASNDLIYVQDDDCVLDPDGFDQLLEAQNEWPEAIAANMPERFRHDFYADHCLVGFGALFDRALARRAFAWFDEVTGVDAKAQLEDDPWFRRTCDIVFTALSRRVLVDVGYRDLPWASDGTRMWRQPEHVHERQRMLDLVRRLRANPDALRAGQPPWAA